MRTFWTVVAGMTAAALSACGIGRWFERGERVEVFEVARAQLCGAEPGVRLLDSADAVRDWLQRAGIAVRLSEPLEPGRYALIEMGQRTTGGYGLAVSRRARQSGAVLRIQATFFAPAPGAMTTQMLTSPCALVRLPDSEFGVIEVYDQNGQRRLSSVANGERG
ncbi:protease complex subunit PrcB family protein [Fontimonas sp. SYSU GA230001]|uniref:protease complex subunit PrcB family protein n=1 Tax=Fontimonas sp. SYSU GA230001 TaxID=3142450 RepID=UPI0032B43420